jgi:hypothetical protein
MLPDWDFGLLEELIQSRGDPVTHEVGLLCPKCNNEDPYASRVDHHGRPAMVRSLYCSTCDGNGFIYRNSRCIIGLVTGVQQAQRDLIDAGYASPGDAVFSPSLHVGYIGDFDRITFTNTTQVDGGQVIVRGAATMNDNSSLVTDLSTSQDRLWYLPECVTWCEDANGVVYTLGQDFTFTNKKINWTNGPHVGVPYVIKYRAYMEWLVYASPMERFDRTRNLAQRVLLRKKHVHFMTNNKDSPGERADQQLMVNKLPRL